MAAGVKVIALLLIIGLLLVVICFARLAIEEPCSLCVKQRPAWFVLVLGYLVVVCPTSGVIAFGVFSALNGYWRGIKLCGTIKQSGLSPPN